MQLERDYTRSAWATRRDEIESGRAAEHGLVANGLPEALLGRVGVVFATIFVEPNKHGMLSGPVTDKVFGYDTPEQAYRHALRQVDYYQRLFDTHPQVDPIRTQAELDAVLATWAPGTTLADHHVGLVLLMEGADPVVEPPQVEEWAARGVRIIGPAWSATRYAGGTGSPGPLTDLGRALLDEMARYNLILDLSHMTEEGYFQALDRYPGPVIASHSNPAHFWDHHRNLTDRQIVALAEHGGVMGTVLYNRFMNSGWTKGAPKSDTPLTMVIDIIDHVCQVTGSANHIGIGTDIDGGFGAEDIPEGIDTVADLLLIGDGLRERGFGEAEVEAVLSGNFLRVLRSGLPG